MLHVEQESRSNYTRSCPFQRSPMGLFHSWFYDETIFIGYLIYVGTMLSTLHSLSHLILLSLHYYTTWSSNWYPHCVDEKTENRWGITKLTNSPKVTQLEKIRAKIHTQSHSRAHTFNHYTTRAPKLGRWVKGSLIGNLTHHHIHAHIFTVYHHIALNLITL